MMVQTGAANPDARQLPLTDRLMEEAMEQVITHEIGHAIGLPHNMVASSSYPVDSLRSQSFASRMGVAPTIMDYERQNYIAQPGDGLRPEDELGTLDEWIVERAHDRMYKYLPQGGLSVSDPRAQTEDMGRRSGASQRVRHGEPEAHRPEARRVDDQAGRGLHRPRRNLR